MLLLNSAAWGVSSKPKAEGRVVLSVRDVRTGYALPAIIDIARSGENARSEVETFALKSGSAERTYPEGRYLISIRLEGYQVMRSWFVVEADKTATQRYMLSPISPEHQESAAADALPIEPSVVQLDGVVTDDATGRPISAASIELRELGVRAETDRSGRFSLSGVITAEVHAAGEAFPGIEDTLIVRAEGYQTLEERHVLLTPGRRISRNISLFAGRGEILRERRHPLLEPQPRPRPSSKHSSIRPPAEFVQNTQTRATIAADEMESVAAIGSFSPRALVVDPPDTIRVGFSGTGGACCLPENCTTSTTYMQEDYVTLGLGNEWIASWGIHSLRAGTIAYRAYGTYRTQFPRGSNHDICSSPCCQAFTAASEGLTSAKTAGIGLQRSGLPFFAEYSAENNSLVSPNNATNCASGSFPCCINLDLSCGNGAAGSPNQGWPCLADSVGSGFYCAGHGRGMSQWGTKRWSELGKTWSWMVNHYYNADGTGTGQRTAFMTSPLAILTASPNPAAVVPGGTFQIQVQGVNYSQRSHSQVLLGASLRSGTGAFIDDSGGDTLVALAVGTSNVGRSFRVPSTTAPGDYDLLVALWLDVDENASIGGDDLALDLRTLSSAVRVEGATPTASPSPRPSSSPSPTASPSPKPSNSPAPTASPSPSPSNSPAPTTSPSPKPSSSPAPTASPSPKPSNSPAPTASPSPSPSNSPAPTASPSPKPSNSPAPTASPSPRPSNSPGPTASPSPKPSNSPAPTASPSPAPTNSPPPGPPTPKPTITSSPCGDGTCDVTETATSCPGDCGCAASDACGSRAPGGCYCDPVCVEEGDCCPDACGACGLNCTIDLKVSWANKGRPECISFDSKGRCELEGVVKVTNTGAAGAAPFRIEFYRSNDAILDGGDLFLKAASATLEPGEWKRKSFLRTLPKGDQGTDGYVIGLVDARNTVQESDETNNVVVYKLRP